MPSFGVGRIRSLYMYPFSAEEDRRYIKYLFFDTGVMQTLLGMAASEVLTSTEVDLVNKGGMSEMFAGLELIKYQDCHIKPDMYYWQNSSKMPLVMYE